MKTQTQHLYTSCAETLEQINPLHHLGSSEANSLQPLLVTRPLNSSSTPPLPLDQYRQEAPEIKVRPQRLAERDICPLMTLPEHEITQSFNAACSDE